jgi:beta-glucosidase
MNKYKNSAAPIDARIDDLISMMTLDEKVAQLGGVWAVELMDGSKFSGSRANQWIKDGIGQVCRAGVGTTLNPSQLIEYINDLQSFLINNTRLSIPALVHEECLNGLMMRDATIFPQIIGMSSTWEPSLTERMTSIIREQMMSVGIRQGLSPVLDVGRDPRWGRLEETFGEDPFLISRMGIAYVNGLQGENIKEGVVSTLKHFVGYGKPEGGLNQTPSDIPPRMLREEYLYPFEKAVKEAGALSIMNAYNEIDGIPCAASKELLTTILRDEWGFEGIVVSDYFAVQMLQNFHMIAATKEEAGMLALSAGIDQELPKYDCLSDLFKQTILKGQFPVEFVDRAVRRILKLKFILGIFENPYVKAVDSKKYFDTPDQRKLALEAARKSIVLLKNDNDILPLDKKIGSIAIIGPNADNPRNQLGDYTYAGHIEVMNLTASLLNCKLPDENLKNDQLTVPVVSVLDGIRAKVPSSCKLHYTAGDQSNNEAGKGLEAAVEAAKSSEAVIMVVGGKSGLSLDCTSGETRDKSDLDLPAGQTELVKAVYDTGKPIVLVIVDGRPVTLGWIAEKIPAVLEAWLPGEEGGNAVADVIFGDYNPAGRLSVSFPRSVGQIPVYYGMKPSGGKSQFWGDYVDEHVGPQYSFGHGLSYSSFKYENLKIGQRKVRKDDGVNISVEVTNTGKRDGEEVVQLYINDVVASVTRPVKQLKGFERIALKAGEIRTVTFKLPVDELAFYNADMNRIVEPGIFKVMIGKSSTDIQLEDQFEVII